MGGASRSAHCAEEQTMNGCRWNSQENARAWLHYKRVGAKRKADVLARLIALGLPIGLDESWDETVARLERAEVACP